MPRQNLWKLIYRVRSTILWSTQHCGHYRYVSRCTVRSHHRCARTPIQSGRPEIISSIPAGSQWSPETCGPLADCWAEAVMEWVIKRDESINSAWDNACGERELKEWQEGNVDPAPMCNMLLLSVHNYIRLYRTYKGLQFAVNFHKTTQKPRVWATS